MTWVLVTLLVAAVFLVAGPERGARDRLTGRRTRLDLTGVRRVLVALLGGPVWRLAVGAAVVAGVAAGSAGGPVAAVVAGAYAGLAVHEWRRLDRRKRGAARRMATLDELTSLVADLRAGIPAAVVAATSAGGARLAGDERIQRLTGAVWRLAEHTGAPAADLLERIESDARETGRLGRKAGAQAAGAQVTAGLLAVLPFAGIGAGYVLGGDPMDVLLHTPGGAGCAIGALILQCCGLKWAQRIGERVLR
ncbi:hypothetical protein GCM10010112_36330 [Actinoplanes lobatus]|uniref:Tight adherence protein B n=1 Tax=Actinoplanes lobatus TaxID=113568 RepID=A0A7W7HCU6_9ACTN|nr:hypothetical protein [Actinoplanes lobatus]MBB4748195.1 tight adherence protein B [Actinoplanes lobatus]GGN70139.1 hypothetical protein GCM10010112_36330 [Actinoplanes lobatus]GIE40045.1 hypothetical protein Alo02nite_29430 [Actinoplanes lobatus]